MICRVPRLAKRPGNESEEHFLLKQVMMVWLKVEKRCDVIAQEVHGFFGENHHYIADVVGLKITKRYGRRPARRFSLHVVEVKVSRSDFRNGYCTNVSQYWGGLYDPFLFRGWPFNAYFYVCTPPRLVRPDELEPEVGLVECDLDSFVWDRKGVHGVQVVKKAKRKRVHVNAGGMELLARMAGQLTSQAIYNSPWVCLVEES